MEGSYSVRIHGIEERKNKAGKVTSHRLSWVVDGEDFKQSFKLFAQADAFRSELLVAARKGESFSRETGLPLSQARKDPGPTWYTFATRYVDLKWPGASANHRRGISETMVDAVEVMLSNAPGRPRREEVRAAMLWACSLRIQESATTSEAEPPADITHTVAWLKSHTVRMTAFAEPKTGPALTQALLRRISRLLDGSPAAESTRRRKRAVLNNLMVFAVECHVLAANPLKGSAMWAPPKTNDQVDVRTVVNADQARRLFSELATMPHMGPRLVAFFGCMYYAALRPEEVIGLQKTALISLPKKGWGEMLLDESEPEPGTRWTATRTARERRGLKHKPAKATRPVPIHPDLVALLRDHLTRFPNTSGYVFRGPRGGAISDSTYLPYFKRARTAAFTEAEAASPLATVPYALRHAAVSTWLNAGVAGPQVAEWAGHTVEVLYRVYAKCIAGQAEEAKRRILEASSSPGSDESADASENGEEPQEDDPQES